MICRFKTHQAQPSIALSRSERTCRVVVETGTKSSTSKTAIIKTHLLSSMFLVAPKLHQKKNGIWISMLQIPRMESPLHLLSNSTFIFCNDSKAKALQDFLLATHSYHWATELKRTPKASQVSEHLETSPKSSE